MSSSVLVVHERIGHWARQLRPRLADRAVRLISTRSGDDLERAVSTGDSAGPVVLIDLGRAVRSGLEDLARIQGLPRSPLVLVLDPGGHAGVGLLGLELGATHVISGPVPPPTVAALVQRWLALAARRAESAGWSGDEESRPEPEPWNWLNPLLKATS